MFFNSSAPIKATKIVLYGKLNPAAHLEYKMDSERSMAAEILATNFRLHAKNMQ